MRISNLKSLKRIGAALLAFTIFSGVFYFSGFARDISPNLPLGSSNSSSDGADIIDENLMAPLGISSYSSTAEIILPDGVTVTLYEELNGIPNYYSYQNWVTSEEITGTFTSDTVLIANVADTYNGVNIVGDVKIQRITSEGDLEIYIEGDGTLTIEEHTGETPLKATDISIRGDHDSASKLFVKGTPGSHNYDIAVNILEVNSIAGFMVEPNATYVGTSFSLFGENLIATFKVGENLPLGATDGVYLQNMNLHSGARFIIESTNLPENALRVADNFSLYPGHIAVTGGGKNAILANGSNVQAHHKSSVYAKATAPGSIGIFHNSSLEDGQANMGFGNTELYAEGDAYGIKLVGGSFYLAGSLDWNNNPIGESTIKGGISALFVKSGMYSGVQIRDHKLNLILTGSYPNAEGAFYFDPNNSSSQIMVVHDATINAISEEHSFQGAAINVVDNFVPIPWASEPIALDENGQIITTMPTYQENPFWAIKVNGINMGTDVEATIIQNYTDIVTLREVPSFPFAVPYNAEQFQWSTDPSGLNIAVDSNGFTSAENASPIMLTGVTATLPSFVVAPENNLYHVTYSNVSLANLGIIILDPTEGALSETSHNIAIGQPIGELPNPENPRKLFMGWFTNRNGQGVQITPDYVVTATMTLYAYWTTPLQQITFQPNVAGTPSIIQEVAMGELLTPPQAPNPGATLVGWYQDTELTISWDFASEFVPNNALALYAKWSINDYMVTFLDGSTSTTVAVSFDSLINEPEPPQNGSSIFLGWFYGSKRWNFQTDTMPSQNITLTAHWENIEYYTLTFDTGTSTYLVSVAYGALIPRPEDPIQEGKTFLGWFYGSKRWNFQTDTMPSQNITLTAHWENIEYYTLTFDTGTSTYLVSVAYGVLIPRPEDPIQEGKIFIGWFYDSNLRSRILWNFDTDVMLKKDFVLHAHWKDDNSGSGGSTESDSSSSSSGGGHDVLDKDTPISSIILNRPNHPSEESSNTSTPSEGSAEAGGGSYLPENPSTGGKSTWMTSSMVASAFTKSNLQTNNKAMSIISRFLAVTALVTTGTLIIFLLYKKFKKKATK